MLAGRISIEQPNLGLVSCLPLTKPKLEGKVTKTSLSGRQLMKDEDEDDDYDDDDDDDDDDDLRSTSER